MGAREVSEVQVGDTWSQGRLTEERSFELKWAAKAERRGKDALLLDRKILCEDPRVCRKKACLRHCPQVSWDIEQIGNVARRAVREVGTQAPGRMSTSD